MKLIRNAGTERVLDLIGPELTAGARLDLMTPVASLFAFDALRVSASKLGSARLVLPRQIEDISLQGGAADRPGRNRLNTPALARAMAEWLQTRAEVRSAAGAVPQGLAVMRSSTGTAVKALHGAFGLSTDGLGLTPRDGLQNLSSFRLARGVRA